MIDVDMDRRSLLGQTSGRAAMLAMGAIAASAALPLASAIAQETRPPSDIDILNFALNLEYLETEYYLRGVLGRTLDDVAGTSFGGSVRGGRPVRFSTPVREGMIKNIGGNELAHVRFVRQTVEALEGTPIPRPVIDLEAGFAGVARGAGLPDFDPFANEMNFFLGALLFEDVGVTVLKGSARYIRNDRVLESSAGLLGAEGYHVGALRAVLSKMGAPALERFGAISDLRDRLDGRQDLDQPLVLGGKVNISPSNENAIAYGRTPQHALNILYGSPGANIMQGGFFPEGVNGAIRAT